jgi:hypothetical protein
MIIYITFLLNKFICRDINSKKTISLIGLIIALLIVIFRQDIIVGIYIGVIAIGLLFIGYNYKDYNNLFKFGVIVLIINIIYQLGDLWEQIPFWLYLLVGGLSIIGFVTYKEIKK